MYTPSTFYMKSAVLYNIQYRYEQSRELPEVHHMRGRGNHKTSGFKSKTVLKLRIVLRKSGSKRSGSHVSVLN